MSSRLAAALAVLALVLVSAGTASAYYSTTGAGSGATQTTTILGPSNVTVSQSGANVTVSWSAATLSSGAAVQGYQVTRSGGTTVCGVPTLVTGLSCTDSSAPSGTYTYTVTAVYNSWDASATSGSFTVLTAPAITSEPPSTSNSTSASFSFSGGNAGSYQCRLDGGGYGACTSPSAYSGLSQGSHTWGVRATSGTSSGPSTTYTWTVDTVAPAQTLALASGASGAYLNGTNLYFRGNAPGSFKLVDTVSDSGSGSASGTFPLVSTAGWTHAAETVTTPGGGPYTSSAFTWTTSPGTPPAYSVTGADAAGNTTSTSLTFVADSTAPTGGALTVNGAAATPSGTTSQATNSTNFAINSRADYSDSGSGLASSVLTVQSLSVLANGNCSTTAAGPFSAPTTITGTTQPSGIVAGYCYLYTLTGTDHVGNTTSVSTTVNDTALSFKVSAQVTTATAGVGTSASAIVLTAMKNGSIDPTYTGAALTWSGANNSPTGVAPTLPPNPSWTSGQATFGITLVNAETETLSVSDGTRSATFAPIVVGAGTGANIAWTNVSTTSPAGIPSPCSFTCAYASGFGNGTTWTASVSITDSVGNVLSGVGSGHSVTVTLGGQAKGSTNPASPATLTIPATGAATSTGQLTYTSVGNGNFADTLTAAATGYASATASFKR